MEEHQCQCGGKNCPRHYLAFTGLLLGGFLVLHLAINTLGLWPDVFQAAVNRNHALGPLLPALEIGLIFLPLTIMPRSGCGRWAGRNLDMAWPNIITAAICASGCSGSQP